MRASIEVWAEVLTGIGDEELGAWKETLDAAKADPDTECTCERILMRNSWRVTLNGPDEIVRPTVTATMNLIHMHARGGS